MRRRAQGERGSVLLISCLFALTSILMVGLVVDLGQLRVDRRTNKAIADLAARAGVSQLAAGPAAGVCKARDYLLSNAKGFTASDLTNESWSMVATSAFDPAPKSIANPCPSIAAGVDVVPCVGDFPASWVKYKANASNGRFSVEIQTGYDLRTDSRYPEDALTKDVGTQGGCDNIAVLLTEHQGASFSQDGGRTTKAVRVRSVGRLNAEPSTNFVAALHLLERKNCNVLSMDGTDVRVIAKTNGTYPGTIQVDSDRTDNGCKGSIDPLNPTSNTNEVINLQPAQVNGTQKPRLLACSTNSTDSDCQPNTGNRPSRLGMYALNTVPPSAAITPFGTTYGDTKAVASPRVGRGYVDERYRASVAALDAEAKAMLTNGSVARSLPPGCGSSVTDKYCTGTDGTWVVVQNNDCANNLVTFFSDPSRATSSRVWFDCSLTIDQGVSLTLSGPNSYIMVTGALEVNGSLTITDPRKVYIGNKVNPVRANGLNLTNPTGVFNVNMGAEANCAARSGPGRANQMFVADGALKVGSGFTARMCQTFTYLASGYEKWPDKNNTVPCITNTCNGYSGKVDISSGAILDLSAPNQINGRYPTVNELTFGASTRFEDIAMWTEAAGGSAGKMAGGATSAFKGLFFFPNAREFVLTGNTDSNQNPVNLSAQFVMATLKVSGNATVNLAPDPLDSIPMTIYNTLLVR
jgi:hypothetical protein